MYPPDRISVVAATSRLLPFLFDPAAALARHVGKSALPEGCITSSEDRVVKGLECAASLITRHSPCRVRQQCLAPRPTLPLGVTHGESSKLFECLASPRNTKNKKHLQSTQSNVNRKTSQTKHQALSKGRPGIRITPINTAAVHASAQQQPAIITRTQQGHHQILSTNAARCEA